MSEYFSKVECAGGCGNLLPQSVVDNGRKYLWGHKGGCPKEGESARRKKPGVELVRASESSKTGPVVHTSYERTLAMTLENLEAARVEIKNAHEAVQAARCRLNEANRVCGLAHQLVHALIPWVDADSNEYKRAAELLAPIAEVGAAAVPA